MNSKLKQDAVSGIKYSSVSTIVTAIAQFLRIVILTRFLDKIDFGLVAIVTLVLGFTNLFSDLGFSVALMHKQNVTRKEFSSIYWLNWGLNISLLLIILIITPVVANFYSEALLNNLIPLMGCELLFGSIGKLYAVQMQKEMNFKFISIRDVIGAVLSLFIAVLTAYYGFGVYSIVISTIASALIINLLNFVAGYKYYPILLHFSFQETKSFLKIGLYQTGAQIFDYLSAKMDVILIGKFFGTSDLGLYNLAKELVLKPVSIINSIINKVALPIFSKVQNDDITLKNSYCKVIKSLTFVTIPVLGLMFLCSKQLVTLFYGIKFLDASPLFAILVLWGLGIAIGNPSGSLAVAKGKTKISFYWTLVRLTISPIIVFITCMISIKAVAYGQDILAILFFYLFWKFVISKLVSISFKEYFALVWPTLFIAVLCILLGKATMNMISFESPTIELLVYGGMFSVSYLGLSWLFNKDFFQLLKR